MNRALAIASLLLLAPGVAEAKRIDRLAVLPIIVAGPYGEASLSSVLDDVSDAARLRAGLRLLSNEEMFVASSSGLGNRVRDCGSDTSCIVARLRTFDARLGLVVVVNLALEPALISLQLLDTDDRRKIGEVLGELTPEEKTISNAIRTRARRLFEDAGYTQAARIAVEVSPPAAKVSAGDGVEADEGTPNVFTVPAGRYTLTGRADGYKDASSEVVVTAGQEARVVLALDKESSLFGSPWFWAGVAVVVAGGTTAAIVATRPTTRCLCLMLDGKGCEVCDQ